MTKARAEKKRNIDFTGARRGAIVTQAAGKTKISIRLDNWIIIHFRTLVDEAGGGNYQTLINDALIEHIHRKSTLDVVRQVIREEMTPYSITRRSSAGKAVRSGAPKRSRKRLNPAGSKS